MLVATPLMSATFASVNTGVPVPFGLLYRSKVTVPVGLNPPETVAWSAISAPTDGSRLLRSRNIWGGRHDRDRLNVGCGADGVVVGVAVVGCNPVVGAGGHR